MHVFQEVGYVDRVFDVWSLEINTVQGADQAVMYESHFVSAYERPGFFGEVSVLKLLVGRRQNGEDISPRVCSVVIRLA
jgi:hypothetical protein